MHKQLGEKVFRSLKVTGLDKRLSEIDHDYKIIGGSKKITKIFGYYKHWTIDIMIRSDDKNIKIKVYDSYGGGRTTDIKEYLEKLHNANPSLMKKGWKSPYTSNHYLVKYINMKSNSISEIEKGMNELDSILNLI